MGVEAYDNDYKTWAWDNWYNMDIFYTIIANYIIFLCYLGLTTKSLVHFYLI